MRRNCRRCIFSQEMGPWDSHRHTSSGRSNTACFLDRLSIPNLKTQTPKTFTFLFASCQYWQKFQIFHFHFSDQGCWARKSMHIPESTKVWSSLSLPTVSKARGSQTCVHITISGKAGFKHIQISGPPSQPSDSRTLGVGPIISIRTVFPHSLLCSLQGCHSAPTVALRLQTGGSLALNSASSTSFSPELMVSLVLCSVSRRGYRA